MSNQLRNPKFSIIVPVYNVMGYIEITLKSILSQTFSDFELLAIDDGSTDGSGDYLDVISRKDNRVHVFHQHNSGVSAARNLGLNNARGEWIVFVDGDDALKCDALGLLSKFIAKHPKADLIGYGFEKVDKITEESLIRNHILTNDNEQEFDCHTHICFAALNHYMVWTETFRRELSEGLLFQPLKNGEDVLFCNTIGMKANHYVSMSANIYLYLQREISAKNNEWTERRHEDYLAVHYGIYDNISTCNKTIDKDWIWRWVGGLLYYEPSFWKFTKISQLKYFHTHRNLLKKVRKYKGLPRILRIWLTIATAIKSRIYYKLTAMIPMRVYSNSRK